MARLETILRICSLGPEGIDIPIYVGPDPSRCKWIVVTRVPDGPPRDRVTYIVYFLDPVGITIDFAQRDTLREAMDTAKVLSHVTELRWITREEVVPETGEFGVVELQRIYDEAG